jgi:hypothetical protein
MNEDITEKISALQAKYADTLMQYPHVVGIGIGLAQVNGVYTDEPALVILVDEKVPEAQLTLETILPRELDGVRVDVQATGVFTTF